jgi:hypothetical protein
MPDDDRFRSKNVAFENNNKNVVLDEIIRIYANDD